jgi:2-(1,2-epoxy-1,2-dihydrophenyl)acetyl-CoA isomerase
MTDAHREIRYEKSGAVATLMFNRPDSRNGITGRMMHELHAALVEASHDSQLKVLVLTGAGKDFCPGADIKHYAKAPGDGEERTATDIEHFNITLLLHEMPAVTVAAIRGACAGAGFGWACACDLRFASPSARFNSAFLDVAVAGDMAGPWSLPRLVGAGKARELYFLPGKFDAAEALRINLVNRVFEEATFDAELATLVGRIASAAPLALRGMKQNFIAAEKADLATYIQMESERHTRIFSSDDTKEAFAAYVQKRKPAFKGR